MMDKLAIEDIVKGDIITVVNGPKRPSTFFNSWSNERETFWNGMLLRVEHVENPFVVVICVQASNPSPVTLDSREMCLARPSEQYARAKRYEGPMRANTEA